MIASSQKLKIIQVLNVFETGSPNGRYDAVTILPDGRNQSRQITYGRSQTTEQGNLKRLIQLYCDHNGGFALRFRPYLTQIGVSSLVNDAIFIGLLKQCAQQDPLMHQVQDDFFDQQYYQPAFRFFTANGFTLPLSMLVIYDSYIHSGGVPRLLRKRFGEYPPAAGGDEKKWVTSYTDIRHQWLKYHPNEILRKTIYRTQCLKDQIARNNWDLSQPMIANGVPLP